MTRTLPTEQLVRDLPDGTRVLFVVPAIPDDAPDDIREALARRRLAAINGVCPCGETGPHLTRQQRRAIERQAAKQRGQLVRAKFEHRHDCPAGDERLYPLLRAWLAGDDLECAS